jgi:hypothetical protein
MYFDNNKELIELVTNNLIANEAFQSVFYDMKEALQGKISGIIRIYPFDTGLGKSTLIKSFIAEWKAEGFKPEGSILIALNTKSEINEFAAGCGLDETEFAAYTSDDAVNEIGAGANMIDRVPVLFTTHSMLRRRLIKKTFESAREFYYKGGPRSLRIWDEHSLRAEPIWAGCSNACSTITYAPAGRRCCCPRRSARRRGRGFWEGLHRA